jgi:DNA invertase Pin-like site-specific DNA recombinase
MSAPTWVGYLRVSTEEQLKGEGLEVQRDAIVADAAEAGATVVAWYRDEALSGSNGLEGRTGLAEALGALDGGEGSVLAVFKLDRLARDLIVQEQLLAEVWRIGASVHSTSEAERVYCRPDDPDDPSRKFIRQILGAAAEYERAMIRLRMVRGRRRKLAAEGYAGGPAPYGWRHAQGGGIEPDEAEQAVLGAVEGWRAEGYSWAAIAADLNGQGFTKRNGEPWSVANLHKTLGRASRRGLVPSS